MTVHGQQAEYSTQSKVDNESTQANKSRAKLNSLSGINKNKVDNLVSEWQTKQKG